MLQQLFFLFKKLFTKKVIKVHPSKSKLKNEEKSVEVIMGISLKEIIRDTNFNTLDKEVQDNLMTLLERINKIRQTYGKSMIVTSGLRTIKDHLRIYKQIAERKGIPFDESKVPMGSKHLIGAAVDILDPKGELDAWCQANVQILEQVGLWVEHPDYTKGWTHFQIYPPKSGKRFFIP